MRAAVTHSPQDDQLDFAALGVDERATGWTAGGTLTARRVEAAASALQELSPETPAWRVGLVATLAARAWREGSRDRAARHLAVLLDDRGQGRVLSLLDPAIRDDGGELPAAA